MSRRSTSTSSSMRSKRNLPPQPPMPVFLVDGHRSDSSEDVRRDPFLTPHTPRTPEMSAHEYFMPSTPKSEVADAVNPFSPPASVTSFSAEQSVPGTSATLHARAAHSPASASLEAGLSPVQSSGGSLLPSVERHTGDVQIHEAPRSSLPNVHSQVRNSFMSPPVMPRRATTYDPGDAVYRPGPKTVQSTMLTGEIEKPWIKEKDTYARISYLITWAVAFIGVAGGAIRCYFGWRDVPRVGNLCPIMTDNFATFDLENTWTREVDMGGFGNGEFQMTTDFSNNSYVNDGKLYIVPTLTSDVIGYDNVMNGYTYNISGCTSTNLTSCGAVSNSSTNTVINPVMSARISTKNSHSIKYGKVEVVAKLPLGDWLWPAIWMLPVNEVYGAWPASGEIDIMESRGNGPSYKAQGDNYVRSQLQWGPFSFLNAVSKTYGWWTQRRSTYADGFHTYAIEWTDKFVRIYVDTRLDHMLEVSFNEPFWDRGDFPDTILNGSEYIETPNPWANGTTNAAPFDQEFYLLIDLAVGGTNGWFPDGVGNKPWLDGSTAAMHDFAQAQETWYATWPQNVEDRAFVIDSVKMWQSC